MYVYICICVYIHIYIYTITPFEDILSNKKEIKISRKCREGNERHYMCYKRRSVLTLSRTRSLVSYKIRWGQGTVLRSEGGMIIES
jgi:hypothetical protein